MLGEEVLSRYSDVSSQHVAVGSWCLADSSIIESKDSILSQKMFRSSSEAGLCDDAVDLQSVVETNGGGWQLLAIII